MNFKSILTIGLASLVLYGCSNKTSEEKIAALALASKIEVIPDNSDDARLAAFSMAAYSDSGTDYSKTVTETWVDAGEWQEPLAMADMLVCIMGASSHSTLANATYQALIDMTICNNDTGDQAEAKANFADVVMTVSRASNVSDQIGTGYFTQTSDQNNDGDTTDANEKAEYVAEIVMSESATTSNPYGVVSMDWNQDSAAAGDHSRGSLAFTNASTTEVGISFIEENKDEGSYDFNQWVAGTLKKDGSGGSLKVSKYDNGATNVFKVAYNGTHAKMQKNVATATCVDLNSMTTYVSSYSLFNATTGALKDISAGLEFVHGSGKDKRGYAGSYKDGSGNLKHWMWVQDGTAPDTIYAESNHETAYSVTWSSGKPTISGITFDLPIRFEASFVGITPAGVSATRNDNLNYEGPGQLYGIDWSINNDTNSNGDCDPSELSCDWTPAYNLADGLELTDTDGTKWRVKRTEARRVPTIVDLGNCSALSVANADVAYTKPTLSAVTKTFTTKPVITGKPKVIQGVLQY